MLEPRTFIVLSHDQTPQGVAITGIAERYNTQLKWEATLYASEDGWIIEIPRQNTPKNAIQTAYDLVFEGYTDFRTELQTHLNGINWETPPSLPFEMES